MKSFTNKFFTNSILIGLFVAFALCIPSPTSAQVELPSLGINRLTLSEYYYSAGQKVNARLDVENVVSSPTEFRYKVEIYSANETTSDGSQVVLSTSDFFEKVTLLSKESREIPISYTVPKYIRGDILLNVLAYNDEGILVGQKNVFLKDSSLKNSPAGSLVPSSKPSPQVAIKKVQFKQDGVTSFEPLSGEVGYLFSDDRDLEVIVETEGRLVEDTFIAVKVRNIHDPKISEATFQSVNSKISRDTVTLIVEKDKLSPGVYELLVTPVTKDKIEVGPSRKFTIGIDGVTAIIQAFEIKKGDIKNGGIPETIKSIKRGDDINALVNWVPLMQISRELADTLAKDEFEKKEAQVDNQVEPVKEKPVTMSIRLVNEKNVLVASSTVTNPEVLASVSIQAQTSAEKVLGIVEISYDGKVIASYEKMVFQKIDLREDGINLFVVLVILILIIALLYVFKRYGKHLTGRNVTIGALIFMLSLPTTTFAWTLKSSASFANTYPKARDAGTTNGTTTWATAAASSPWQGIAAYSRTCTARTAAYGVANTNYTSPNVPTSLAPLSGDNKMYPWENFWYHVPVGGQVWYSVNKTRAGVWPNTGSSTIAGVFTNSLFAHAHTLAKLASLTDDLTGGLNNGNTWKHLRPARLNSTNQMGTNVKSALATTTFSNLSNWLAVQSNVLNVGVYGGFESTLKNEKGYIATDQFMGVHNTDFLQDVPMKSRHIDDVNANPLHSDFMSDITGIEYYFPNNSTNYTALKNSLGISSSTLSIVLDAAGFATYSDGFMGNSSFVTRDDEKYFNSRPGTYKMFNFLYTMRDETDGASKASTPTRVFDCVSKNMQIFEQDYEIVPNSYIEVITFHDADGNGSYNPGVSNPNEKMISTSESYQSSSDVTTDGGYIMRQYYNTSPNHITCNIPRSTSQSPRINNLPHLYGHSTSSIAVLVDQTASMDGRDNTRGRAKMAGIYVKSGDQVVNPLHFPKFTNVDGSYNEYSAYYSGGNPMRPDARYRISFNDAERFPNTASAWAIGSGIPSSEIAQAYYDETGKMTIVSDETVCGNSVAVGNSPMAHYDSGGLPDDLRYGFGGDGLVADEYKAQVIDYPAPPSIVNNTTPYFKIPVNWALSRTYEVGTDEAGLPTGWTATTPPQTVDLGASAVGNQHHVVYLGVAYTANGVCGTATTTTAIASPVTTSPTSNLCTTGSNTPVVTTNEQDFTWTCEGYGITSTDATCMKPKCSTPNSYYCEESNSCVADEDACIVNAVCGSAHAGYSTLDEDGATPITPADTNLCLEGDGINGLVAGVNQNVAYFSWTCNGSNGGTPASCNQTKCQAPKQFCQYDINGNEVNNCQDSCQVPEISIFNTTLSPKIVRKPTDQCTFSWNVNASTTNPVTCTLNGNPLSHDSAVVQRSQPLGVGRHTLECSNGILETSTTTRCQLSPNFIEI